MEGREQEYGIVPATLGLQVKQDIPGIENSARIMVTRSPVKLDDNFFSTLIVYADPDFVKIFTVPPVLGDPGSISSQSNIIISESLAGRLFGKENPLGKSVVIINDGGKEFVYRVSAVITDFPDNSSFSHFEMISHYDNFLKMWDVRDADWRLWVNAFFIRVADQSLVSSVNGSLKNYLPVQNRARQDFRVNRFNIIPLEDVGESTRNIWSSSLFPSLHPAAVIAPPVMAVLILLIACFNFANTSRSVFSRRLKEIGLRKTFGGLRKQLVSQFMIETFIVCFLSLFAGLAIAEFLVPAYSNLWDYMSIELTFTGYGSFWLFLVLLVLLTGGIAGVYPAWYVSSFNPVNIIKGDTTVKGTGKLSLILLTLQFTISVMSLVLGVVFSKNADYQRTLDVGYDRSKLIVVPVPESAFTSFKNEAAANPQVISAAGTVNHIGWSTYRRPVKDQDRRIEVDVMDIGPEYAQAAGLRLEEGRLFDLERIAADRSENSVVVNRKFVNDLGWKEAVGRSVTLYDTIRLNIIGVVEDFYTYGVWQSIEPTILRISKSDQYQVLVVRGNPENLASILGYLSAKWKTIVPNSTFNGRLVEDDMQEEKDINGSILKVNLVLAIVATILSLIGMYNLVSLDILKRTREIGIRKINGAPVPVLMYLISRKYIIILAAASIAGCAGGYFFSRMLLDSIWDYFVDITAGLLLLSVLMMAAATFMTAVLKILKAALQNPAESMRYE
jgi:ABC-type antimicrobial peptide transport system permease subunit